MKSLSSDDGRDFLEQRTANYITNKYTEDDTNMDKQAKNFRVLDIYVRLCEGKMINKAEEAVKFGVDARSIQRDIDDIRAFLEEQSVNAADIRKIEYNHLQKGFVMTGIESSVMSNSEILAVSKILLGSRAFTKKHMYSIIDKMIAGCVPIKNLKLVSDLIANEKYHYVELRHKADIGNMLWEMGMEIEEHNLRMTLAGKWKIG